MCSYFFIYSDLVLDEKSNKWSSQRLLYMAVLAIREGVHIGCCRLGLVIVLSDLYM